MQRLCAVAFLVFFSIWCPGVYGDDVRFMWTFGKNFVQQEFVECQRVPIVVEPLYSNTTYIGVPPYYFFAFEPGGTPTVTMLGNDPQNLTWQVNHKQGSSLMLAVMDSNGTMGGVAPSLYNVTDDSDGSCITQTPSVSSVATVTPNVTSTIKTCDPWGLTVTGGKKPYTIVLSALNSPVMTNVTMGPDDDVFTFIDRADPNELLMASVVDADGQWGISSGPVLPTGSTDVTCIGLVSSSQTSAEIAKEAADRANAQQQAKKRHTRMIIGICVAVGVAAILALALGFWYWRKRRNDRDNGTWDDQDVFPRAYELPYADATPETRESGPSAVPLMTKVSGVSPYTPLGTPDLEVTPIPPVYFDREIRQALENQSQTGSASDMQTPTSSKAPLSGAASSARYRKALEARSQTSSLAGPSSSRTSATHLPLSPHSLHVNTASPNFTQPELDPEIQPDIIIQHRDGGAGVVQELPPPYVDRTLLKPSSPSSSSPPELNPS